MMDPVSTPAGAGPLPNLFGLDRDELAGVLAPYLSRAFQTAQVYEWMYARQAGTFGAMSDLPVALRQTLGGHFRIGWPGVAATAHSSDGSKKHVMTLEDGCEVEAVHIVYGRRVTFCLSSQVGCPLDCRFCLTGTMGLVRNLTPGEIVGQVAVLARDGAVDPKTVRVVFMGMGEPLNNYDAVMRAFRILSDPRGYGIAPRRVTLSTAGLVPEIDKLGKENPRPRLAVSLGASHDAARSDLMPINRKYSLGRLMESCRRFPLGPRERITFEYVLLAGLNDGRRDAHLLARQMHGVRAKVNVIPYNETGASEFRTPTARRAGSFRDALLERGIPATIRWSKGRDIGAACGQLVRPSSPPGA